MSSDGIICGLRGAESALREVVSQQPHPLIFVTISGAHLYGFPSADSDYDLRGVHVLPLRNVIGLSIGDETIERSFQRDSLEIDLVTHDAAKFARLIAKPNGYVLEQVFSPLVVCTTPQHAELRAIAGGCITRGHAHHYLGFSRGQWKNFETDRRVKSLLYVYRVLLTGIHLMRTGIVEANLRRLNETFRLSYIDELIAMKTGGTETGVLSDVDVTRHAREVERLAEEASAYLRAEADRSGFKARTLTADQIASIDRVFTNLMKRWSAIPAGEHLELLFPPEAT